MKIMILILVRDSSVYKPSQLWTPYIEMIDGVENIWMGTNEQELEIKLKELLNKYPREKLFPISSMSWAVDVLVGD